MELDGAMIELASVSGVYGQSGNQDVSVVTLEQLLKYLRDPYEYIDDIRRSAKYMTNKHGILKDTLRTIKSLPTLYHYLSPTSTSIEDPEAAKRSSEKAFKFLEDIEVKRVVRDGLFEVAETGTVVLCNRRNRYIQFLDIDDLRIEKIRNGDWVVEYDLSKIKRINSENKKELRDHLQSYPDEITPAKYLAYQKDPRNKRYVEIPSAYVIAMDANRNSPYGLPFTLPAWSAILQKDLISKAERNIVDRLVKQILILTAGKIGDKPPKKEIIQAQFKAVMRVLESKSSSRRSGVAEDSGVGLVAFSDIFDLKALEIDTTFIPKDMYDKIDDEIYSNLGVSRALIYGGGSDYSSAEMNLQKLTHFINSILEQFESVINKFIRKLINNDAIDFEFRFDYSASFNTKETVAQKKELYLQTGLVIPYLEAVTGQDYRYAVAMKRYQDEVLGTEELFYPPQNAYTTSTTGNGTKPTIDSPTNPNTIKSKSNGSNNNPSPSDGK
ncbi:hypothetical protein P8825_14630 [Shouchella clausii]|uniref:hypothetical protein n=1 Tax=Shouchella clausii TaxID=79880 RepID=UPI002DB7E16A|nr:hypothetical protein [Shouchella clausii]MEB5480800.1 hypothetical protein [Shouchella clausii]